MRPVGHEITVRISLSNSLWYPSRMALCKYISAAGCGLVEKMTQQRIFEIFGWVSLTGEGCVSCPLTLWVHAWLREEMCYCMRWLIFYPVQNSLCFNVSAELSTSWYHSVASSCQLLLELQLGCPHLPWTSYLTVCGDNSGYPSSHCQKLALCLWLRTAYEHAVGNGPDLQFLSGTITLWNIGFRLTWLLTLPGFPLDALIGPDSSVMFGLHYCFK